MRRQAGREGSGWWWVVWEGESVVEDKNREDVKW